MFLLIFLAIVLGIVLVVMLIRTLLFTPKKGPEVSEQEISFDKEAAVSNLQQLVRCKTISYKDASLEDDEEFKKLQALLPKLYPHVFEACDLEHVDGRGLLFRWKGTVNDELPTLLMAHYDVVPVVESGWEKPPFEGIIEDGVMWGRGTLDTKVTMNGVLFAVDHLIAQGFKPKDDVYLAFSGGEEVNGPGAENMMVRLLGRKIAPKLVVDEGGAVVEGVFPGVKQPCGLIGIAEKGMMNVRYTVKSSGGHASAPKPGAPIDRLSKACVKLSKNPMKSYITEPVEKMFDTLGRHASFGYRFLFANIRVFKPLLDRICRKSGGELNALLRTTIAFTQASGSNAPNVIPPQAEMVSNVRISPADNIPYTLSCIKKYVKDPNVEIEMIEGVNPSRTSLAEGEQWDKVARSVASTWKGCIVSPYLMVQRSDCCCYGHFCKSIYRFSAMDLTTEERATIHGHNERIRLETLYKTVEFYIRLLEQC